MNQHPLTEKPGNYGIPWITQTASGLKQDKHDLKT